MKPLLHPSSIFFFSFTLFISINIPTSLCKDDGQYTNCNKTFNCPDSIQDLKYPFWGGNRDEYCGEHGLKLTCEDSVTKITINSIKYRVIDWEFSTQKLTVARDDYWGGICAVSDYKNDSFNNTPFQNYDGVLYNVTLLYNCASPPTPLSSDCGDGRVVYYVVGPFYLGICTSVVIPLLGREASSLVTENRTDEALKEGFGLKWIGSYEECKTCMEEDGECGYDGGGFRCFCKDGSHTTSCHSSMAPTSRSSSIWNWRRKVVIGASAAGFGATIFFISIVCYLKRRMSSGQKRVFWKRRKFVDHDVEALMQSYGSLAPRRYSYSEVKRITNSFLNKLGEGGYGVVYKATLPDGRLVAVKVLSESKGNGEEFINEVASISRTSHVNIVSLLGFCYDMSKRALIYEFMPNGSLDNFIYRRGSPTAICYFAWNTLYKVAVGIARGLEYLHRGCNTRILHLDIKPQNILLDEDFCPKISDFGLAKICQRKESIVSILGTRGTPGYIAPEVFSRAFGGVSHKSDVYSYGMLILEMVGGRKNYDSGGSQTNSEMYFPDWIYKDLEQGNNPTNYLVNTEEENEMARKMTLVSLWCIQTHPSDRPSMSKVVEMFEGPLHSVPYPPKPVLYSSERLPLHISDISSGNMQETDSIISPKDGSIELNEEATTQR